MSWWATNNKEGTWTLNYNRSEDGTMIPVSIPHMPDYDEHMNGDEIAFIMKNAILEIEEFFMQEWDRPVSKKELRACLNFALMDKELKFHKFKGE